MIQNVDHPPNLLPSRWPHSSAQQPDAKEKELTKGGESSPHIAARKILIAMMFGASEWRTRCWHCGWPEQFRSEVEYSKAATKVLVRDETFCPRLSLFV
jgi:hypothetical protein